MKIILSFFCVYFSLLSCSLEIEHPQRPLSLGPEAFWVGGVDGGNWYIVHSVHAHKNNANISVYYEDGELITRKQFYVICNLSKPVIWIEDLKYQISGFDGQKIYLKSLTGEEECWMQ